MFKNHPKWVMQPCLDINLQEKPCLLWARMGQGSHQQKIQQFKNNIPQPGSAMILDISPSTVHNIIKRFRESREISNVLNIHDLSDSNALKLACFCDGITTWSQEYLYNPLSISTVRRNIHKCKFRPCHAQWKSYVSNIQKLDQLLWAWPPLKWTDAHWKYVLWSD